MNCYVGLDVSLQKTAICAVDAAGEIIREGTAATEPAKLVAWLRESGLTFERIGLEAGSCSSWLHRGLAEAGLPAICVETRHAKGIMKAQNVKTDRNDARALAQMMRTGWFKAVHIKGEDLPEDTGDHDQPPLASGQSGSTSKTTSGERCGRRPEDRRRKRL